MSGKEVGSSSNAALEIPSDTVEAITSAFYRPGEVIRGYVKVQNELLGWAGKPSRMVVYLHTYYNLTAGKLVSSHTNAYASTDGMVYSYNSDRTHYWDRSSNQVIQTVEIHIQGPEFKDRLEFAVTVPYDSDTLRVCPSAPGSIKHELYCVSSDVSGHEIRSNSVQVRLLPAYAPADTEYGLVTPQFNMKGPWLAADNGKEWTPHVINPYIWRRLLPRSAPMRWFRTHVQSVSKPKPTDELEHLEGLVKFYTPKNYIYPIEKEIPIVLEYSVSVRDFISIKRVLWEEFLYPLPGSGEKDEGYCEVIHWISTRIPKEQGGDGEHNSVQYKSENLVSWVKASKEHEGKRTPREADRAFPLVGYGWSDFQDPNNQNRWTRKAFVLGYVRAPLGTVESFKSADGNVKMHSALKFVQPKPDNDMLKGSPGARKAAVELHEYVEFSCVPPPPFK